MKDLRAWKFGLRTLKVLDFTELLNCGRDLYVL